MDQNASEIKIYYYYYYYYYYTYLRFDLWNDVWKVELESESL